MKHTVIAALCVFGLSACAGSTNYVQQNVTTYTPQPHNPAVIVPDGYFLSASGSLCKHDGEAISCRRDGNVISVRNLGVKN